MQQPKVTMSISHSEPLSAFTTILFQPESDIIKDMKAFKHRQTLQQINEERFEYIKKQLETFKPIFTI